MKLIFSKDLNFVNQPEVKINMQSFKRYFKKNSNILAEQTNQSNIEDIVEDEIDKVITSEINPETKQAIIQKVMQVLSQEESVSQIVQSVLSQSLTSDQALNQPENL